jgi:hypothetical protein
MDEKDKEVAKLIRNIYADALKLSNEHDFALGSLIAGIILDAINHPSIIHSISNFMLNEIAARKRLN